MLIITANNSQSLWAHARQLWPRATIIDWHTALEKLGGNKQERLLLAIEQSLIWQRCIAEYATESQSSIESLATVCEEAFWLVKHWGIDRKALTETGDSNSKWFCNIANNFVRYIRQHQCIDETQWLERVIQWTEEQPQQSIELLGNPTQIIFYGFLGMTPLQNKWINALKKSACTVSIDLRSLDIYPCGGRPDIAAVHAFDTTEEECHAALDWIVSQYQKNPQQRLALIVPELGRYRSMIESMLLQKQLPAECFAILSPIPLSEYGLVQTALALLQLSLSYLPELNQLISLLRSPYFGDMPNDEYDRAAFLAHLRALQCNPLNWDVIIQTAAPWPVLQQQLLVLQRSRINKKQILAEWVMHWQNVFQAVLFPNALSLNPEEQASHQRFEQLLLHFSELIIGQNQLTAQQALHDLNQYCAKTFWLYSEKKACASIFITNVLDALHVPVDQAWLMHATQNTIPFKLTINPLLDKKIQKKYGVWALNRTEYDALSVVCYEALQQLNKQLIISFAKEDQGRAQTPAIFCATCAATPYVVHEKSIEPLLLKKNPQPLTAWTRDSLPGGSSALKSQRLCPMQAFAKHRLNLAPLPMPVLGLTAIERGIVVHRALQLIWQQLSDQENLLALSAENLQQFLQRVVPLALKIITWSRRKLLSAALLDLEQAYLMTLLTEWLALEASRPPFKIFALEQETQVVFAEKNWRLRVDRIDTLADGRLLLIDYKTGKTSVNSWQQEIFTEPQLPLYAVTHALKIDAIAFAEVSPTHLKMIGLSEQAMDLGQFGVLTETDKWTELKANWQAILTQLTDDFIDSTAQLAPLAGDTTCKQCGLQSFCRVNCSNSF